MSAPHAILVDFGGVLTTSVHEAFAAFGATLGDPDLPMRLLREDPESAQLIVEAECGRLEDEDFETAFAARLAAHGAEVEPAGLIRNLQAGLVPDEETLALVAALRAGGHPVALVTNSFGRDCYEGFDLEAIADVVVVSGQLGVRKPSRRIYTAAAEALDVPAERCIMVDDLEHNLAGAARVGMEGVLHRSAAGTSAELRERFGIVAAVVP